MNFILAISKNNVIGDGSKLPWNIKEEYQYFLDKVNKTENSLLCGRITYQCISKEFNFIGKNIYVLSKKGNIKDIKDISQIPNDNLWCIGGSSIYNQIRHIIPKKVYITFLDIIIDISQETVSLNDDFFVFLKKNYKKTEEHIEYYTDTISNKNIKCTFATFILI